ncbi:MAG: hypothetical protein J6K96_03985 [Treponema sp.]|nr:hypothetical protein [Treponema sp.]
MERKRNHGKPDGAAAGCTERPNNEKFDGVLEQAGTMKRYFFALVLIVSCVFGFAQARRSEAGRAQTADAADSHVLITIKIGSATVSGVLYGTALAAEIKSRFPLAVSMSDFAGREYYGGVDFYPSPEHLVGGRRTFADGDITYCEAHHNMAIFYAQTEHPNLSVEVIPIGKVTSDLSVFADFAARETVTFMLAE